MLHWLRRRRAELQFGARITVAGVAAFALAQFVSLPQGYWAVFTAVLVTQASVGGSLTAARDRLIGTIGGAAYSAVVAAAIPHGEALTLGLALAVALAPLSVLAALYPTFRVAPVTAVILMLGTSATQEGPIVAALLRTVEVCLGGIVGLAVSVLVLPKRGANMTFETANSLLRLLAELMNDLLNGLIAPVNSEAISLQHEKIQLAFDRIEAAQNEADRERRIFLSEQIDLAPIPRTLRRIYHDFVLVGRVAAQPLEGTDPVLISQAIAQSRPLFRDVGAALIERRAPPKADDFEKALGRLAEQASQANPAGLASDDASRRAALGFAFEQLQRDIHDLTARTHECARRELDAG